MVSRSWFIHFNDNEKLVSYSLSSSYIMNKLFYYTFAYSHDITNMITLRNK